MLSEPVSFSMKCPTCDAEIPHGHRSHRGLLINEMASLGSSLIRDREMLATLEKKRWSKQHDGGQRAKDLATMTILREKISHDEKLLAALKLINEEYYGSGHQPSR